MILVIGRRYRLTRWDRAGTIVTRSIDYVTNWKQFCDILWRLSQLSRAQLGFDMTAERILPGSIQYRRMDEAALDDDDDVDHEERLLGKDEVPPDDPMWVYVRKKFGETLVDSWPRYRLQVPDGSNLKMRSFLVGRPVFRAPGMAGRGTRGYIALDCATGGFVWLKDAWRAKYLGVEPEGAVLEKLAGVSNVPTLVCHGDLTGQVTIAAEWWIRKHRSPAEAAPNDGQPVASTSRIPAGEPAASSGSSQRKRTYDEMALGTDPLSDCPLRSHQHYRMVVKEVAMPLVDFKNGRQLVSVIFDCITGTSLF